MDNQVNAVYQVNFAAFSVYITTLPPHLLTMLNIQSERIKKSWPKVNMNSSLAGHIQNQYSLNPMSELDDFLLNLSTQYYDYLQKTGNVQQTFTNVPSLKCGKPWINFQAKTEYNPLHNHSGLFSWVLWLKIPYNREEEAKCFPDREDVLNGSFNFVYPHFSGLSTHRVDLDESYEGRLILFPSTLQHMVYPFYTTDEYRVSVSGNIYIDNSGWAKSREAEYDK